MPVETKHRTRTPFRAPLDLPPPFRLVTLREAGDAFGHAMRIAAGEGAGTLVFVGRFDLAEFAVVLEPDEPLRVARRALFAGLVALGDALAAHAPPERPIGFDWPDAIRVDGGLVGGGRIGWPQGADEDAPPPWLVFGGMIRTVSMGEGEAGLRPLGTALEAEGFDGLDANRLVEGFARHLMLIIDAWQERGFAAIARDYLARLPAEKGLRREIAEDGDLLLHRPTATEAERLSLLGRLAAPSWLDPATGGPHR